LPGGIFEIPLGFTLFEKIDGLEESMKGRSLGVRISFFNMRFLFALSILLAAFYSSTFAQDKPVDLTGKWNLSWEARLGTEHDPIELKQSRGKLTGTFLGHLGKPDVSGTVDGKNVTLRLAFPGAHPYTLVFSGVIDGEKMDGKFEIENLPNGYDSQGEGARPSNYTWNAVRQLDARPAQAPSAVTSQSSR
jgi:hypothetical protein